MATMSKRSRPSITATPLVAPSARMTLKDRQTKASIDQFECARRKTHLRPPSIRWPEPKGCKGVGERVKGTSHAPSASWARACAMAHGHAANASTQEVHQTGGG